MSKHRRTILAWELQYKHKGRWFPSSFGRGLYIHYGEANEVMGMAVRRSKIKTYRLCKFKCIERPVRRKPKRKER